MKILIGVVLFNPEIKRLKDNLEAVWSQSEKIILVDNSSSNITEIKELLKDFQGIVLVENLKNKGIAFALNQILENAKSNEFNWALTLDQDSVISLNLIEVYKRYLSEPKLALLGCTIDDRNFVYKKNKEKLNELIETDFLITSGTIVNVNVWALLGGFDETMFIDSVDFDFCILVREAGYKVLKTSKTNILHEVGHSRLVNFLGKEELILNHSHQRCYFIIRNTIYLGRKHKKISLLKQILLSFKKVILIAFFEKEKFRKIKFSLKGFIHGFFMKIN